jgi:prophage regulatory protein
MFNSVSRETNMATKVKQGVTGIRILRLPAVLDKTGKCRSSVYREMAEGSFPRSVPIGARAIGWLESDIDAYIAQCAHGRRSIDL